MYACTAAQNYDFFTDQSTINGCIDGDYAIINRR